MVRRSAPAHPPARSPIPALLSPAIRVNPAARPHRPIPTHDLRDAVRTFRLGADRAAILALVLGQGLRMAAAGMAAGLAGSLLLTRALRSLLYGVTSRAPGVFAAVTLLLFVVALLACGLPAWRTTRVDPAVALRE
jgi:predicted lysophospholipase L1 biosynthesis ABC-type transport system permease subunit